MGVSIGIDVSKRDLDWALGSEATPTRSPNTPAGIRRLINRLNEHTVDRVIVESTGGYERALVDALASAELAVILVNPPAEDRSHRSLASRPSQTTVARRPATGGSAQAARDREPRSTSPR